MTTELIPEPTATFSGEPVWPRRLSEKQVPQRYLNETGLSREDVSYAEKAWVRRVMQSDLEEEGFACEWPGSECGNGCDCWIITNALDTRRVQPIWWLP